MKKCEWYPGKNLSSSVARILTTCFHCFSVAKLSSAIAELELFLTQRPGRQLSLVVARCRCKMFKYVSVTTLRQVTTGSDLMETRLKER